MPLIPETRLDNLEAALAAHTISIREEKNGGKLFRHLVLGEGDTQWDIPLEELLAVVRDLQARVKKLENAKPAS